MYHNLRRLILVTCLALALVSLTCVRLSTVSGQEAAKQSQKALIDRDSNSLPLGAITRLASARPPQYGTDFISVTFLPDGRTVATTRPGDEGLVFWNSRTGKEIRRLDGHHNVVFAPDGKIMASSDVPKGKVIRILEVGTGKEVAQVPRTGGIFRGRDLHFCFSPDGRYLAEGGGIKPDDPPLLRLWEVATGKEAVPKVPIRVMLDSLVFSPNSKLLATVCELPGKAIQVWDVTTGEERRRFPTRTRFETFQAASLAFSPDGYGLVAVSDGQWVVRWDALTGKVNWRTPRLEKSPYEIECVTFSPNGQVLAVGAGKNRESGIVYLLEAATGQERCRFEGHPDHVRSVAFSPDGSMLASASSDGLPLIWDVTGRILGAGPKVEPLAAAKLDTAWSDLADDDAAKAWQTICSLSARPKQAVPLLKKHLPPNPKVDPKRLAKLLADLNSDEFEERDRATKELTALGHAAAPALRKLAASGPPLEVRQRLDKLLGKPGKGGILTEELRCGRALEILEYAGTPEAKQFLEEVAKGGSEARMTRQAKTALERLAKRPPAKPR